MTYEEAKNSNDDLIIGNKSDENDKFDDIKQANEHDAEVRKRIDDLLEKKRLKDLLDDSEDW